MIMRRRIPGCKAEFDRREFLGAALSGAAVLSVPMPGGSALSSSSGAQIRSRLVDAIPDAGAWVELDRAAVAANLAAVRAKAGGRPVMGVIKANGYGHGVVPMARLLAGAGIDELMVITVDEALSIRDAGIEVPVLNYGPFDRRAAEDLVRQGIDQAVYTTEAVEAMASAARRVGREAHVQLIFDTGLGRVGVGEDRAEALFADIAQIQSDSDLTITGVATALTEDPEYDRVQLERYIRVCDRAFSIRVNLGAQHVASSAAVLDFPESHLDMVRPGIMLYGHYPNERSMLERPIELVPVMSLRAKVAYVKTLQAGDGVGYHRAWVAERETTVATLPIGHSEGYPAGALAAGGAVQINGRACPLVGGITSNHLEVAVPEGVSVEVGDTATLIAGGAAEYAGAGQPVDTGSAAWAPTAQQVGQWDGAGVYATLMHVNPLLPRVIT